MMTRSKSVLFLFGVISFFSNFSFAKGGNLVSFSCTSSEGTSPLFELKGRVTSYSALDWQFPFLTVGAISLHSGQLGDPGHVSEIFVVNGSVSQAALYWESSTHQWAYDLSGHEIGRPFSTQLHRQDNEGTSFTAELSLGLGSHSYMKYGEREVQLNCDFTQQTSPTQSRVGISYCPSFEHWGHGCRCVYEHGKVRVECNDA